MPIWRLIPAARLGDPRWQDRPIWQEVLVRADTASRARTAAAELERDPGEPPDGNSLPSFNSGFTDEKLYWAVELAPDEAAALGEAGPEAILRAERLASPAPRPA